MAGLSIIEDKQHKLSLRLVLFFPFHCCFAGSLQSSSLTVKQTKLFHYNFRDVFHFFTRKTFLVECLRSGAARGAAKCKRL